MLLNAIVLAFREIRRNVLRSSLTTLGIIIGVASVIIMVTLGNGATAQVTADIANMGSNMLSVMPGQRVGPGGASGSAKPFRRQDVDALGPRRAVDHRRRAGLDHRPQRDQRCQEPVDDGHRHDQRVLRVWQLELATGRWFSDSELRSGAAVCIIGADDAHRSCSARTDPIGAGCACGRSRAR